MESVPESRGKDGIQFTEETLTKFLEHLVGISPSKSDLKDFKNTCEHKTPSKHWNDIVAVKVSHIL